MKSTEIVTVAPSAGRNRVTNKTLITGSPDSSVG